jgi:CBS domain-containing protein
VAKIFTEYRISGLPVCSIEGHVLGVVSEGDILYKEHDPRENGLGGGPLRWLVEGIPAQGAYDKAAATTAGEAMSSPAITIAPYESTAVAARLMAEHGVNRLPVVQDEKLVGIVTRTDLVRAFVRDDHEIEREIREDVLGRTLWADVGAVDVQVTRGAATLRGGLDRRSDAELLERLVRRVPGVVAVESEVSWRVDDVTRAARRKLGRTA